MPDIGSSILASVKDSLLNLVSDRIDTGSGGGGKAAADHAGFEDQLRTLLTERGAALAGRVHVIGLDAIRERYRDVWDQIADKVDQLVRLQIGRHVGPADVYTRVGDAYLLIFADLSEDEAKRRCALIAREIEKLIFGGANDEPKLAVDSVVTRVDRSALRAGVPAVDSVGRALDETPEAVGLRNTPKDAPVEPPSSAKDDAWTEQGHALEYRPMWNTRRKIVSSYFCLPAAPDEGIVPPPALKVDMLVLQRVIADCLRLNGDGRRVIFCVPVHFETIDSKQSRDRYLKLCEKIPAPCRRLLLMEFVGVPNDAAASRLFDRVFCTRPYRRAHLVRTPIDHFDFSPIRDAGTLAVGPDLTAERLDEAALLTAFEQYVEMANSHGLRTYVHGLPSLSLTTAAVCAGFDYVDGAPITSLFDGPKNVYPLSPEQLYAPLLEQGQASAA